MTFPNGGSDPRVDYLPASKDEFARLLGDLKEARREISSRATNEKALADQINQHAMKIEHLTKEQETAKNEFRHLRREFDQYKSDSNEDRETLRENVQYFQRKSRRLMEEKREAKEQLQEFGVKTDDVSDNLCDLIRTHGRKMERQAKWDRECIDNLNDRLLSSHSRLALSLKQGQNSLHLAETYRISNERLVQKNDDLQTKLDDLEVRLKNQSDSDLRKYQKISNQLDIHLNEIARLHEEKRALAKRKENEEIATSLNTALSNICTLKLIILADDSIMQDKSREKFAMWEVEMTNAIESLHLALAIPDLITKCPECFNDKTLEDWRESSRLATEFRELIRRYRVKIERVVCAETNERIVPPRPNSLRTSSNPRTW